MNSGDPLEKMLHELADLFKLVDENKDKPIHERVTPEIQARIDQLKGFVDKFSELNMSTFNAGGISKTELEQVIKNPSSLNPKQKKIMEFSKKLKAEVEAARLQLQAAKTVDETVSVDKQKADEIAKRKKKFKRVGGDKWLHL